MSLANKLITPQLANLEAYQSARRIGGIGQAYLNANELPFPAYQMPEAETWNRYPDFLPTQLASEYASYAGVEPGNVITVRGADEGIDLLIRAFCEPRVNSVRLQSPTYSMYEFVANAHQIAVETIPLDAEFSLDVTANLSQCSSTNLIFLCHPNNPSGNILSIDGILQIAKAHADDAFVVVDEAYIEFCPERSLVQHLSQQPNLVILRTLSKAFGLAAVRLGFIIADESVIDVISTLIAPYPIPDPSARIGLQALTDTGIDFMQSQVQSIISLRQGLKSNLTELSVVEQVYASETNFLLVKFRDSAKVFSELKAQGIILRDQHHVAGLQNHLRISIGSAAELTMLFNALETMK